MAVAALEILDMTDRIDERLDVEDFVPAVGQGCVAVECRDDHADAIDVLAAIDHPETRRRVEIERAYLAELGSGCSLPVGGHVDDLGLLVFLADLDSGVSVTERHALTGDASDLDTARRAARAAQEALA